MTVTLRIDTPIEVDYYQHGGILPYVLQAVAGGLNGLLCCAAHQARLMWLNTRRRGALRLYASGRQAHAAPVGPGLKKILALP